MPEENRITFLRILKERKCEPMGNMLDLSNKMTFKCENCEKSLLMYKNTQKCYSHKFFLKKFTREYTSYKIRAGYGH